MTKQVVFKQYSIQEGPEAIKDYSLYFSTSQNLECVYVSLLLASFKALTVVVLGITYPATIDFLQRVLSKTVNSNIIIASIPVENYISADYERSGQLMAKTFESALEILKGEDLRADLVCIPANTNHIEASFSILASSVSSIAPNTRIIHMPDEVSLIAQSRGYKTLGVLGTLTTTSLASPYSRSLSTRGLDCIYPCETDRQVLQDLILQLIHSSSEMILSNAEILQAVMGRMDVDAFVLGCTEFPMLLRMTECLKEVDQILVEKTTGKPVLDSTGILVDAVVRSILVM